MALGKKQTQHVVSPQVCHLYPIHLPLSVPPNLVVIDEIEILQCGDDIFFLDTSDFTDLTVGGQKLGSLRVVICPQEPQEQTGHTIHPQVGILAHLMVICGLSPLSDFSPIRISKMVWDQ